MASITFIPPATIVAITGKVKQLREVSVVNSSAATYKVYFPSLLSSKIVQKIPWFDGTAKSNYSCGDRSAVVKLSPWSFEKVWNFVHIIAL
ncbi:hypothetical protein Lalb_Chr20g0116721 [Lupinus albus]|uniref:Uncharacterized protein n=1 Tax=Lupinus albus TaxID=3870 RepID=A0A6A4NPY8_LUPAL|nr:hypothetical protein Lalb_Chr20g0116721 [Lupinus albus]